MKKEDKNKIRLNDVPKDNPFSIPEGYFEDFSGRLKKRIEEEENKKKTNLRRSWLGLNPQLAVAAGFIVFIFVAYFLMRIILNNQSTETFQEIAYTDVVENNIEEYDTDLIYEVYDDVSIQPVEDATDKEYEEFMIDYLVYKEDIDMSLITEEF